MKRLIAISILAGLIRCTGGQETSAAVDNTPPRDAPAQTSDFDARKSLADISSAIPVYEGAQYREDLTDRDARTIRGRYGENAKVITLSTDDSFPQVFHYYTTYLSQFRAYPAEDTWPNGKQQWRTLELQLNQAMQDPFIPGEELDPNSPQVLLQVAETEAEPRTVIRYIVTPAAPRPPMQGPLPLAIAADGGNAGAAH